MLDLDRYTEDELQDLLRNRAEWVLRTPTLEVVRDMYAIMAALDEIARGKQHAQALNGKLKRSNAFLTD
jgi:hypothetical protein